jgi:hypothetical protein
LIKSLKRKSFVEQAVSVLKYAEVGVPVAELIRKAGTSEQAIGFGGIRRTVARRWIRRAG